MKIRINLYPVWMVSFLVLGFSLQAQSSSDGLAAAAQKGDRAAFQKLLTLGERGTLSAEFNLGFLYQHGEGVDKDPKKAAEWYQQAAERGHPSAQYNLGGMYLRGDGVEKDLVMAYFWRKLAADDEDEQSAGLAAIAKKMTSSELSKAKKAVKNWKPRR